MNKQSQYRVLMFVVSLLCFTSVFSASLDSLEMISFEEGTAQYEWLSWGNNGETNSLQVVDNPQKSWENSSDKVAKYECQVGANNWAGANIKDSVIISITEDNKFFTVDVLKTGISKVVLILENGDGAITRFDAYPYNTKVDEWETMVFDFSTLVGHTFYKLALQPDLIDVDPRTESSVVYLDNIKWAAEAPQAVEDLEPISFEDGSKQYSWVSWGNVGDLSAFSIVDNIDPTGVNTSDKVGKYICHQGSNSWAGMNISSTLNIEINVSNKLFFMDVYKPTINKVVMILEDGEGETTRFDAYPMNTKVNEWETMVFDFSSVIGHTFHRLSIQPDLGDVDPRTDSVVVYLDNITWGNEVPKPIEALKPISFEDGSDMYEWFSWGNDGDTNTLKVIDNIDASGVNTSAKVGQFICHNGANSWAGMNIMDSVIIEVTDSTKILNIDIYKANISKVVAILEKGSGETTRIDAYPYNTLTNAWETMAFDFSSVVGQTFYRLSIQPDLVDVDPRTDSSVVYIDNIVWQDENSTGVTTHHHNAELELDICPNPTRDVLFIKGIKEFSTVGIYNLNGHKLFETAYKQQAIDIAHLDAGMYLVKVSSNDQTVVKTIIKE